MGRYLMQLGMQVLLAGAHVGASTGVKSVCEGGVKAFTVLGEGTTVKVSPQEVQSERMGTDPRTGTG